MPLISAQTVLAANAQSDNLVEGSSFEFIQEPSLVLMDALVLSGAGATAQLLFQLGGVTYCQPPYGRIHTVGDAEPIIPNSTYHNLLRVGGSPGDRIFMTLRAGAAAATINWTLRIDPI